MFKSKLTYCAGGTGADLLLGFLHIDYLDYCYTHPCIAALTCYNVCVSMKSSWWHLLSLRDGKVVCLLLKLRQVERPRLLSGQKYDTLTLSRLIFKPETDFLERWKDLRKNVRERKLRTLSSLALAQRVVFSSCGTDCRTGFLPIRKVLKYWTYVSQQISSIIMWKWNLQFNWP